MRDMVSRPMVSVPRMCPGEKGGLRVWVRSPDSGSGTTPVSGRMKQPMRSAPRMTPGIHRSRSRRRSMAFSGDTGLDGSTAAPGKAPGWAGCSGACTVMADPRVQHGVEHVGDQVGKHGDGRDDQDNALDDGDVLILDGAHELLADAGDREDLLDDD